MLIRKRYRNCRLRLLISTCKLNFLACLCHTHTQRRWTCETRFALMFRLHTLYGVGRMVCCVSLNIQFSTEHSDFPSRTSWPRASHWCCWYDATYGPTYPHPILLGTLVYICIEMCTYFLCLFCCVGFYALYAVRLQSVQFFFSTMTNLLLFFCCFASNWFNACHVQDAFSSRPPLPSLSLCLPSILFLSLSRIFVSVLMFGRFHCGIGIQFINGNISSTRIKIV